MMVSRNKLTKKDLDRVGLASFFYQSGFNFERMQAGSFVHSIIPGLKKIYGDNKEEIGKAMSNNMDFINTQQHASSFLMGLVLSLEEAGENRDLIKNLRNGLFGPLAGLGDAIVWFTLLPITAAICASLNRQGLVLGPILFMAFWALFAFTKIWLTRLGYRLGVEAIDIIHENTEAITKATGILGVMVIGALIPTYVNFNFSENFVIFETVEVQSIFDAVIPNLLPMAFVFFLFYLLKKKHINVTLLIFSIIIFSIILAALGWM